MSADESARGRGGTYLDYSGDRVVDMTAFESTSRREQLIGYLQDLTG